MKKHTILLSVLFSVSLFAANAQAFTYTASDVSYSDDNGYSGTTTVGNFSEQGFLGIASPGQITWDFTASAGTGIFDFDIAGYRSLDGYVPFNTFYSDKLAVYVNGTVVFSGIFSLINGGDNLVTYNPGNAAFVIDSVGSVLNVTGLALNLLGGSNTIQFVYSGLNQNISDEGWGLNSANIVTNPVPEPEILFLITLGLIGMATAGKQSNKV